MTRQQTVAGGSLGMTKRGRSVVDSDRHEDRKARGIPTLVHIRYGKVRPTRITKAKKVA